MPATDSSELAERHPRSAVVARLDPADDGRCHAGAGERPLHRSRRRARHRDQQTARRLRIPCDLGEVRRDGGAGKSLVVHANPDDEKTDPAGNTGPRIACGVIVK